MRAISWRCLLIRLLPLLLLLQCFYLYSHGAFLRIAVLSVFPWDSLPAFFGIVWRLVPYWPSHVIWGF